MQETIVKPPYLFQINFGDESVKCVKRRQVVSSTFGRKLVADFLRQSKTFKKYLIKKAVQIFLSLLYQKYENDIAKPKR